jgi:hypothetical protein
MRRLDHDWPWPSSALRLEDKLAGLGAHAPALVEANLVAD